MFSSIKVKIIIEIYLIFNYYYTMISIICSTREIDKGFKFHVLKTCGVKDAEFLFYENKNQWSLTEIYNKGLNDAKYDKIVFLHNDIHIETNGWGYKLLKHYEKNPGYGILGVAGTKYMATTGKWWEDRRQMYGRVKHTHEEKSWLTSYSPDLGNDIENVVAVDGVFFSVDRKNLKVKFDESFKGYHFYDIPFCVENFINGVKIGVHTNIRINHMSIGATNEMWEASRVQFTEKYKNNLPLKVNKEFGKHIKMKVLISCLNFNGFTGSEMYVYELAKELIKQGCDVSVCSNIGNPLARLALKAGIKLYTFAEPPGFKIGDGKWGMKSPDGKTVISTKDMLYQISVPDFDIIHLNHKPVTEHFLKLYPTTPVICGIHSEIIDLEHPVIHENIKKYIAIRPEIKEFLIKDFNIPENKIDVIYNPIDYNRFKPLPDNQKRGNKRILFVGTLDYLRKNTIMNLIETTKVNNEELWVVGNNTGDYLDLITSQKHVRYFPSTFDVEKYIHQCDEVASILLGRTAIEGWLCGKNVWIYDVDSSGNINNKKLYDVPEDINKFKSDNVAKQIIEEYKSIINQ